MPETTLHKWTFKTAKGEKYTTLAYTREEAERRIKEVSKYNGALILVSADISRKL